MADSISDADKIRNKRLAKLGGNQSSSTERPPGEKPADHQADASQSSPQAPESSSTPKINISRRAPVDADAAANPLADLASQPSAPDGKQSAPRPVAASPPSASTTALSGAQKSPRARPQAKSQTLEDWEDETLGNIFRVTVKANRTKDHYGHALYFLSGVKSELEETSSAIRLSKEVLESAILEAASATQGDGTPMGYLLGCWKRVSRIFRQFPKDQQNDPKFGIVKEARRLCMSYCIFAATMPEMFGRDAPQKLPLHTHLLLAPESEQGIDFDFLAEAVSRFEEDESIRDALVEAMMHMCLELGLLGMNDDYKPYVQAMKNFSRFPKLIHALADSEFFLPPDVPAQDMERKTFLGPFFQISPMQAPVAVNYFSNPTTRDRANVMGAQHALRLTLRTHQDDLFGIMDRFVKAGREPREKTLDWVAACLNKNHKRRAMRPDRAYIATDSFMLNLTVVLDMLCEPFMDATFSKIGRIEAEYFRRAPRVDIQDETKINADQSTADAFYARKDEGKTNFISDIFFLTAAAHHYGTESINASMGRLRKDLQHMDKQLENFKEERAKFENNPDALRRFDEALKKYEAQTEAGHCVYFAMEGVLLDDVSQARSMSFMRYVMVWLIRLVSGVDFPKQTLQLPLSSNQPEVFSCLPEYFIEDIVDHFKFVTGHIPHVISPTQVSELVMVCITFLRSSEYVKNPYLKSGLVTILFYGVMPVPGRRQGVLGDALNSLPFALQHLLHALMKFYIECESTGSHTQFYDKFNIRYEIFQVIKCIWSNTVYREHLATEARENNDFFVHFVNLLLNDVTFVLDESLSSFHKINQLQREIRDPSLEEQDRQTKQEALDEAQRKAKSYMQLTNESVATLKLFTDALADQFTAPEVVQRLADMLDYNLATMVGPKQNELRVDDPEQYGFRPKLLLGDLMDVYLHLAAKPPLHLAIARDGRSYSPAHFKKAAQIAERYSVKSPAELKRWAKLAEHVAAAAEADAQDEQDYADAPDEFLDPILSTLMADPVILPTSKSVVDRATIRQHLLSDPHDPFNRAPLKIEDVKSDEELRGRIEAFKKEKRELRIAATAAAAAASAAASSSERDNMDTTPG